MMPAPASEQVKSVGQVVAYNVMRARKARGLTQEDLAERLREVTGRPWPRSAVTMTENAWTGSAERLRTLDVNQVVAFAVALETPLAWFFMAPDDADAYEPMSQAQHITCDPKHSSGTGLLPAQLMDIALSRTAPSDGIDLLRERAEQQAPTFVPAISVEQVMKEAQLKQE